MKMMCGGCNELIEVADIPQPEILNQPKVSVIVVNHPKTTFCLNCKKPVTPFVTGANLHLNAVPLQAASPIVIAPGSALPKNGKA